MKKTILVAGGAGFIGSSLSKNLISKGNRVICVDNLYTGSIENIKELINNENFKFINQDIIEPINIDVDEIYNLACPASPVHYQKDPLFTLNTSYLGTLRLLELAKKTNAKYLMASTSEVYGDPQVHPQIEEYWGNVNPVGPRASYDEGKRVSETLTLNYNIAHGVKTKIVRIFNTYGHNMSLNDGRVISNFIVQALKNEPITVYGDGLQTRSFCHVNDMVEGLILMMNSPDYITGPFNIGNPLEYTILDIAKLIIQKTNSNSVLSFLSLPKDDPFKRKPSIEKAQKYLSWSPIIKLEDGLDLTISYFSNLIGKND